MILKRNIESGIDVFHKPKVPSEKAEVDFIISVDRCLMSDHHGFEFLGFMATAPAIGLPERIWRRVACPPVSVDPAGRPRVAPYGLRKVEAALQEAGFKACIIDPDYVPFYVKNRALALMVGHHDYFAFGPPSNQWWMLTGREPVNRKSFIEFISMPEIWEAKHNRGLRVVVGGPAAWQWEAWPEARIRWPVDTIVEGEGEKVVVELAQKILDGEELPKKVVVRPGEEPKVNEIPTIRGGSVNGLVEIMRGCPRGCKFCSVTFKPLRFIPLEKIEKEIKLNLESKVRHVILHSEDVLLYGADAVRPKPDPLLKLHSMVAKYLERYGATFAWSHASLATIKYAEEHGKVISKISEMVLDNDIRKFLGVEVGIETGSPKLAKKIMPAKVSPYPSERYPEVVEEAFMIMADNRIIPAATFILGLPGETEDDVLTTIELLERLKPYPSIIVPMFFVPLGALKNLNGFKWEHVKPYHIEAMKVAALHSIRWAKWIFSRGYLRGSLHLPIRLAIYLVLNYVERKLKDNIRALELKVASI